MHMLASLIAGPYSKQHNSSCKQRSERHQLAWLQGWKKLDANTDSEDAAGPVSIDKAGLSHDSSSHEGVTPSDPSFGRPAPCLLPEHHQARACTKSPPQGFHGNTLVMSVDLHKSTQLHYSCLNLNVTMPDLVPECRGLSC